MQLNTKEHQELNTDRRKDRSFAAGYAGAVERRKLAHDAARMIKEQVNE